MASDAFKDKIDQAKMSMNKGEYQEAITLCISISKEGYVNHRDGLINIAETENVFEQVFEILHEVSDDRVVDRLGQAYWILATNARSLEILGNDLYEKYMRMAEASGWTDFRMESFMIYGQALDIEDYQEAFEILRKRAQEDPGAWLYVGELAIEKQKFEEAEKAFERIPRVNPNYINAQMSLAEIKESINDLYGVDECYERALNAEPWNNRLRLDRMRNQILITVNEIFEWELDTTRRLKVQEILDSLSNALE